jgi:hypothetical protein
LKFGQIFSCHHFFSLCLEILTWFLVYECIMMSYRSSLHFVPVQWFLTELWPVDVKFGQIFSCHHFFLLCMEILTWFLVWVYNQEVTDQLWNSFRLNYFWPTYSRWALKFGQIFSCHHFISLWFEILTWFL